MNSQDFEFVSQLLRKRAGIVLSGDKMYLLESRLAPLARKEGLPSIDDLIHVIRARREERLIGQLVRRCGRGNGRSDRYHEQRR